MKKLYILFVLLFVLLFISVTAFGFNYITLLQTEDDMIINFDGFYGSWIFIDYYGFGSIVEKRMFMPQLYIGGGLYASGISFDRDLTGLDFSAMNLTLSFYGKYFVLSGKQTKDLIGFPLIVGASAGFSYSLWFKDTSIVGSTYSSSVSPFKALAVAIIGYETDFIFKKTRISLSLGLVDNKLGYYADLWVPLDKKTYFHLYWVPLLGLGASYTMTF